MIAHRRQQEKVKPGISPKDKALGKAKAKRQAALDARRGLVHSSKPTKAQVDKEIQKQAAKTVAKQAAALRHKNVDPAVKAALRRQQRDLVRTGAATIVDAGQQGKKKLVTTTLGRPPSKKAIRAAVTAMEEKGFKVPPGYRMIISFAPKEEEDGAVQNDNDDDRKPAAKGGKTKNAGKTKSAGKKGGGKK